MALPKKVKKDINIAPQAIQPRYPYGYDGETTPIRRRELADFITEDGFHITEKARAYLQPLIEGEAYPEYSNGLPQYAQLKKVFVNKKIHTSHEEEAL